MAKLSFKEFLRNLRRVPRASRRNLSPLLSYAILSVALALPTSIFAQCSISELDQDNDGTVDEVVLENNWHRIRFQPSAGGRANSWVFKPLNKELAFVAKHAYLFGDEVAEIATEWNRYLCKHPYRWEIVQNTPAAAQLKLHAPLPELPSSPDYHRVEIRRTYKLEADSPALEVHVEVFNGSAQLLPFTLMLQHNAWVEGETSYYYCPDETGLLVGVDEITPHGSHAVGSQNPADGWAGYISATSRLGLAFVMQWKYLDAIENWLSSRTGATVQWPYLQQEIPAGQSWHTRYLLYPLVNMESLDFANEQVAAGVLAGSSARLGKSVAEDELKVGAAIPLRFSLTSPKAKKLSVEASVRILPEPKPTVSLGRREVPTQPGQAAQAEFTYIPQSPGMHVLSFQIREGDQLLGSFERPIKMGESDHLYIAPSRPEEKIGRVNLGRLIIDPPLPESYFRFDRSLSTPHIPWGRPHAGGMVRTLFVSLANYTVSHWREIWQRGDIALDHTLLAKSDGGKPYPYSRSLLRELHSRLINQGQDVVFFAGLNWQLGLPPDLRQEIFSRIRRGLGAVILADPQAKPDDPVFGDLAKFLAQGKEVDASILTDGMPFRHASVRLWEFEQGRAVVIHGSEGFYESIDSTGSLGEWDPPAFAPYVPGWEYSYGLFVKAIYWAARRPSPLVIRKIDAPSDPLRLTIENLTPETFFTLVQGRFYNRFYEPEAEPVTSLELKPGLNTFTVPVGVKLSPGKHLLDVILRNRSGASLGWGSTAIDLPGDVLATLKMDRPTSGYRSGDPVRALVSLRRASRESLPLILKLRAVDAFGREAFRAQRALRLDQPDLQVEFDLSSLRRITVLHDLHLEVFQGDRLVGQDRHTFYVFHDRSPVYDDFQIGIYGNVSRQVLHEQSVWRSLRSLGVDEFYTNDFGGRSRDIAYRHGFFMVSRLLAALDVRPGRRSILPPKVDSANLTVTPSLSDPQVFQAIEEHMKNQVKSASELSGIDIFVLGDEWTWGIEFDYHPDNLGRFRDWLQKRYPSLEALNRQWGTPFNNWTEVIPVKEKEIKGKGDLKNLSSWFDFRHYMSGVWGEYVRRPYLAARSVNSRAEVGFEGMYATSPGVGSDAWQILPFLRVTARYNSMLEEWFRSVDPDIIHGPYGGYGVHAASPRERFFPWRALFHGGHWCFYYMLWTVSKSNQMILDFDGSPHGAYPILARDEWADIKSGIGKLFIETRFTDDGIALPYSLPSIYCGELLGVNHFKDLYNHKSLVEELGFQHNSFLMQPAAGGDFLPRGTRVLFLPTTLCLSDETVEAILLFVRKGGIAVADYLPGVRDQHGRLRNPNPLDELFGVDRAAVSDNRKSMEVSFLPGAPASLQPLRPKLIPGEPGLKLRGRAEAWGSFSDGSPLVIVNRQGKGRAVYTNLDIGAYGSTRAAGAAGEVTFETRGAQDFVQTVQAIYQEIARLAGLRRRVTLTSRGKPLTHGETFYYTDETQLPLYVGTLIDAPETHRVEVQFPHKAHLYDVRDGAYHGLTDRFEDEFHPGRVQVYAALPYRVDALSLSVDRPNAEFVFSPGADVRVRAAVQPAQAKPVLHVFRVEVYSPSGGLEEAYTANYRGVDGRLDSIIPLGHNAAEGTWRVVVTDVATRTRSAVHFEVGR